MRPCVPVQSSCLIRTISVIFIFVEHVWNVMTHTQKPYLVFQRNWRVHLNRRGCQFSRLLAVEECGSAGRSCIDHVPRYSARVVATLSIRLFPLHFPYHASPCAITFRTASTIFVISFTTSLASQNIHQSDLKCLQTSFIFRMLGKITDTTRVCEKVTLLDVKSGIWRTCTE
jgi:hypothetical protein